MPRPLARLTTRRMMVLAAVVAACLSFGARADRLRSAARERVREASGRLAPGHGRATAEDWRAFQAAQDDLLKADFLEAFGVVVSVLALGGGAAVALRARRGGRAPAG